MAEHSETEIADHAPLAEAHRFEAGLQEAAQAAHRASDSIERQVATMDTLVAALPALTQSVKHLSDQLDELLVLAAPLQTAERDASRAEHELSLAERFLHHRRGEAPPSGAGSGPA